MIRFEFQPAPGRIIFGRGTFSRLADEVAALGWSEPLIITTAGRGATAAMLIARDIPGARVFDQAEIHAPAATVEAAAAAAKGCDGLISYGGGSAVGVAKVVAIEWSLPIIAVPTTFSGSEMTPAWSVTKDGKKAGGKSQTAVPRLVIYDPELTETMPRSIAVTSAINAMAHCVEALYPSGLSPLIHDVALDALRRMAGGLQAEGPEAADGLLYGAHLSGLVMAQSGMAFHHKLCHVLGGFGLPHSEIHTVLLPHAIEYNRDAAPAALASVAEAIGAQTAAGGIWDLAKSCGAPMRLTDIGFDPLDIPRAVELVMAAPYPNPRPMEQSAIAATLQAACDGDRPQ